MMLRHIFIAFGVFCLAIIMGAYSGGLAIFTALIAVGLLAYFAFQGQRKHENKVQRITEIFHKEFYHIRPTYSYISADFKSAIAVDDKVKKLFILDNPYGLELIEKITTIRTYSYKDIMESQIIEDGVTITKTSRTSQIGGAVIGGLLAGGVGAVIGGLSGSTSSTDTINKVELKINVNDSRNPVHYIRFLSVVAGAKIKKDHNMYREAKSNADRWQGRMSVLIRQADEEVKAEQQKHEVESNNLIQNQASSSVADELTKLNGLLNQGIITQDEFDSQKKKLLA